jgi:hypothetical protein
MAPCKNMRFIFSLCLFLTMVFFDNCTTCSCKQVPCPAFNDTNFNQWFPYNSGDQVIFWNNSVSDTFNLYADRSASYEISQGCFGANGSCMAHCYMYSNELYSSYNRKFQLSIYGTSPKSISLDFYQFNCQAIHIADTGLVFNDSLTHSHYYPSLNVRGKTFSDVQLITRDTAATYKISGPYKVFLAKKVGIIAYEIYPDLSVWVK